MLTFIDHNEDAKILQKSHDMASFMFKSYSDLEILSRNQIEFKDDLFVLPQFRPMSLNVAKAMDAILKINLSSSQK